MIFEIDGKEIDIEALESDTLIVARPNEQLSEDNLKSFSRAVERLRPIFSRYGITVLCANKNDITFEVLKAKAQVKKAWDY